MSFNARVTYTANGGTDTFSFSFPYILQSHVKAFVNGTEDTNITFPTASSIQLSSTPANGAVVLIQRTTPSNARLVDFQDGSVLTSADLDQSADQNFFLAQETSDNVASKMGIDASDRFDALNKRIINVANPTDAQDAVTKHYLENTWLSPTDKATLNNVNTNISAINTVNSNISAIQTTNSNATNINTVATNIGSVNTVASDITKVIAVANDLAEAVSEVETVADDLNETTSEIDTVATNIANVNTVGTNIANVNTVAGISSNVTTVAGISANVTSVAGNETNINAVNSNSSNINTVAGAITNVNNVGGSIANVNSVANNLSGINSFADRYRVQAGIPSSGNDAGDLVFDLTAQKLKVFDGSSYQLAGSSVNGTSQRFKFTATANQTTFSSNDDDGNSLTYDPLFLDVYLNGVRLVNGASNDFVATNGTSIVLNAGASAGDILNVVSFGTFSLASIPTSSITSGTLPIARGGTGLSSVSGQADKVLKVDSTGSSFILGQASSPEVYGFIKSFTATTINYTIAVQSVGGANKYFINGEQQPTLELLEGNTYIFDWSGVTSHPFRFSTTSGGTHNSGTEYTTGVTVDTTNYKTTIVVASGAPTLYYYCQYHSGMGGQANTPVPANNTLQVITTNQGADNISNTQFNSFTDTLFSASGFTFSIDGTSGNLIATI